MAEIMADVGQPSALCAGDRRDFEGLAQGEMARMRLVAQGVDDEDGDAGDFSDDLRRDMVTIAEVSRESPSRAGKNVSVDEHFSVRNLGRGELDVPDDERSSDFVRFGPHIVAEGVLSVESVVKNTPQIGHGVR